MCTAAISSIPPTGVSGTRKPCWKDRSIPSAPSAALKRLGARECKPTLPTRRFRGALLYRDNVVPFRPQTRRDRSARQKDQEEHNSTVIGMEHPIPWMEL